MIDNFNIDDLSIKNYNGSLNELNYDNNSNDDFDYSGYMGNLYYKEDEVAVFFSDGKNDNKPDMYITNKYLEKLILTKLKQHRQFIGKTSISELIFHMLHHDYIVSSASAVIDMVISEERPLIVDIVTVGYLVTPWAMGNINNLSKDIKNVLTDKKNDYFLNHCDE